MCFSGEAGADRLELEFLRSSAGCRRVCWQTSPLSRNSWNPPSRKNHLLGRTGLSLGYAGKLTKQHPGHEALKRCAAGDQPWGAGEDHTVLADRHATAIGKLVKGGAGFPDAAACRRAGNHGPCHGTAGKRRRRGEWSTLICTATRRGKGRPAR